MNINYNNVNRQKGKQTIVSSWITLDK